MTDIAGERAALAAQGLDIIHREAWAAVQDYTGARAVTMPAVGFVLHISVTQDPDDLAGHEDESMRAIERVGVQRFGAGVGFPYNAAAFDTGRLYEGQPLTRRGAHTVNALGVPGFPHDMNWAWRALCLPQLVTDEVTDPQIDAAARWAAAQIRAGYAIPHAIWSGHRDYAPKGCPGDHGYARIPELNLLTRYYEAHGLQEDDPLAEYTREDLVEIAREGFRLEVTETNTPSRTALLDLARRGCLYGTHQLVVPVGFVQGGDVYFTDFTTAGTQVFPQGSPLHQQIKADLTAQGLSTKAREIDPVVLAVLAPPAES